MCVEIDHMTSCTIIIERLLKYIAKPLNSEHLYIVSISSYHEGFTIEVCLL